jgi:L-aspartate oxidase
MRVVDFLVIGGGVAGLRAAAGLAEAGRVLVVTKEGLAESNTAYAQGGIAVAMGGDEDVALHLADTIAAGDGLVDAQAAAVLVEQGPQRVAELLAWGTGFDRYAAGAGAGELMKTREGAHSLPRILHAHGDATGREIAVSLLRHVRGLPQVECMEWAASVDVVVDAGRVVGATLLDARGELLEVRARAVLLASGGAGHVYSETTNPAVATGDGIAMAYRAGAELMDMEFYQFHPTAFALEGAPRFLMSEALRGEGAWLVNARGERFMQRYHAGLELAPRDVVARAIAREGMDGPVYLDMRAAGEGKDLKARFPGISAFLAGYGLELERDLIPVSPAAHYMMGGVRTDVHGRASIPGLFVAGEAACTGVHGANRLASNSLLEGLVFGALAAEAMVGELAGADPSCSADGLLAEPTHAIRPHEWGTEYERAEDEGIRHEGNVRTDQDVEAWIAELRGVMWRDAGLLRDGSGLRRAQIELAVLGATMPNGLTRRAVEARNMHMVAAAMVQAALGREESRGAHFRRDFPGRAGVGRHSVLRRGELRFVD